MQPLPGIRLRICPRSDFHIWNK